MKVWRFSRRRSYILVTVCILLFLLQAVLKQTFYKRCIPRSLIHEMVYTPQQKVIPKYDKNINTKTFKSLVDCKYSKNGRIECPDVRKHGETMNRQSLLALMRLLTIFHLVCEKYSIDYWLEGGTFIGTIRNGRMIPWDHDTDVCMIKEDYERLQEHIQNELPDDIIFQDGSHHGLHSVSKLRDDNSCYMNGIRQGFDHHDGLQLDIFIAYPDKKDTKRLYCDPNFPSYKLSDIFPTVERPLEGVLVKTAQNYDAVLSELFGDNYMQPLSVQQPITPIPIPWYSCELIKNFPIQTKDELLRMAQVQSCEK